MRWLALAVVMALAAPAAAQDEPVLGVSNADGADAAEADDDGTREEAPATGSVVASADAGSDPDAGGDDEGAQAAPSDNVDDGDAGEEGAGEPAPRARWTDERAGAWAGLAVSFGVSVLGGVLLAVGVDDLNTIENAPGGTVWADVAAARDRAPILTGIGAVVLGLGVAGTAVSSALLAHFGAEGTWLEVSLLPGGLQVRGRF